MLNAWNLAQASMVSIVIGWMGLAKTAFADIRSETRSRDQAIASFLTQMVTEKPTSQDRIRSLKGQLIDPQAQALLAARKEAQERVSPVPPLPKNFGEAYDYEKAKSFHKKRWEKIFAQKRPEESLSPAPDQSSKASGRSSPQAKEELILDGKGIPREVDFPGQMRGSPEEKGGGASDKKKEPLKSGSKKAKTKRQ